VRLLRTLGPAGALFCLSHSAGGASGPTVEFSTPAPPIVELVVEQTGWVTDAADILTDEVEQRLAAKLDALERRTRHQVVIVTLPTLAGRDVAEVADHLGNTWHIGRVGYQDGAVVLIAPNERVMRISTADGMRQLLPDETCQQIIDETMIPRFRADDLPGGIEAGTDALIARLG
jgi:uncharacterized protein